MPSYLASQTLRNAIDRLGDSIAQPRVADYLVFKRALMNTRRTAPKADAVETGMENKPFQEAITEFAACAPGSTTWTGSPFFSPFGSKRDGQQGFKSPKYPSNGPSDTIGGWQSRPSEAPLLIVPNSRPKAYKFVARSASELTAFLLKKGKGERPSLLDAARWWFRFQEMQSRFGHDPDAQELCDAVVKDLDLTKADLVAIFEPMPPSSAGASAGPFQSTVADPVSYLPAASARVVAASSATKQAVTPSAVPLALEDRLESIVDFVEARGFIFSPWQIAAYVTAVRTKPFVILAGISGTGKTKLPRLVAEATKAEIEIIPVHPDWTDGSELIGYERITGDFVPGRLLRFAKRAQEAPAQQFFALLDEMNVARVEHYLADVLSHIEEREKHADGFRSRPLAPQATGDWNSVCLPSNLCIVGSVNMDETTHGFSRKVLDRSFVIEFSDVDLGRVGGDSMDTATPAEWKASDWTQRWLTLAEHPERKSDVVTDVIGTLETINDALSVAQLQVGYRVRDEIALFRLNARDCEPVFRGFGATPIDPLDLAVTMKILPRIQGGGTAIQDVLDRLSEWADPKTDGTPSRGFPLSKDRIDLMRSRLRSGFTSYWL